jgi:hypothetical protein
MNEKDLPPRESTGTQFTSADTYSNGRGVFRRRSFLKRLGMAGAAVLPANALLMSKGKAQTTSFGGTLTKGDVAILRLLAAAELIEADLWQQLSRQARSRVCRKLDDSPICNSSVWTPVGGFGIEARRTLI